MAMKGAQKIDAHKIIHRQKEIINNPRKFSQAERDVIAGAIKANIEANRRSRNYKNLLLLRRNLNKLTSVKEAEVTKRITAPKERTLGKVVSELEQVRSEVTRLKNAPKTPENQGNLILAKKALGILKNEKLKFTK